MRRLLALIVVAAGLAGAFWWLTRPDGITAAALPAHTPDPVNGERVFWAAGCASCHAAPGARGDDRLVLSGGLSLETPLGPILVPNISPDPGAGIGGWSTGMCASSATTPAVLTSKSVLYCLGTPAPRFIFIFIGSM